MADISAEIAAFKNAVYGEDVRDAMVSLANKINNGQYLDNDTDFNDLLSNGFYIILSNRTGLINAPDTCQGYHASLFVYNVVSSSTVSMVFQLVYVYTNTPCLWIRYKSPNTTSWSEWKLMNPEYSFTEIKGFLASTDDLNDLTYEGFYTILNNKTILNSPESNVYATLMVLPAAKNSQVSQTFQLWFSFSTNKIYIRHKPQGTTSWSEWKLMNPEYSFTEIKGFLASTDDLNDLTYEGFYTILNNKTILNSPESNVYATLMVLPAAKNSQVSQTFQLWFSFSTNKIYIRHKPQGTTSWSEWKLMNPVNIDGYSNYHNKYLPNSYQLLSVDNTGTNITILQYNVTHYMRGSNYMTDEQMLNFRKMLGYINPDIALIAEDTPYIDGSTKQANQYLYNPILPRSYGSDETSIKSKYTLTSCDTTYLLGSSFRPYRYGIITLDGKSIFIGSLHLSVNSESDDPRELRKSQLIRAIEIAENYSTDYIIIGGDFNFPIDSDDIEDLTDISTICQNHNLYQANGGYFGWIITTPSGGIIDNVLVSNNISINNYVVLENWYSVLQSDHYPTYIQLTLL